MPNQDLRVPLWCPVCSSLMKGKSSLTWYKYKCCIDCVIEWIEGREERWLSGWRPSAEEIAAKEQRDKQVDS